MTTKRTRRSADLTQLAQNASTNRLQIQFEPCTSQQNGRPPVLGLAPIGQTRDTYHARFTYRILNRRTVEEIQGNIVDKGDRNLLSRLVHAKNDKDTITGWKLDLNRILHVFNVRSVDLT